MPNCRSDQIINPKTNHCVKVGGKVYQNLVKEGLVKGAGSKTTSPRKGKRTPSAPKSKKPVKSYILMLNYQEQSWGLDYGINAVKTKVNGKMGTRVYYSKKDKNLTTDLLEYFEENFDYYNISDELKKIKDIDVLINKINQKLEEDATGEFILLELNLFL